RLFTNHFGIRFSGRIHEQIAPSVSALKGVEKESKIILNHVGYSYTGHKAEAKRKRNEALLKKAIRSDPSAYNHFTLAQHFALYKNYRKAIPHFRKALQLGGLSKKLSASLRNIYAETLIRTGKKKAAEALIAESLAAFPDQIGAYYLKYMLTSQANDIMGQIKALETIIEQYKKIRKNGKTLSSDVEIPVRDVEYRLIQTALQSEEPEYVVSHAHRLRIRPHLTYGEREILGKYFLVIGDWEHAGEQLKKIYYDQPENTMILDLLGLYYLKQKKFSAAIHYYNLYHRLKPKDEAVKRRLAGLYAKIGEVEKAEALISQ
ncbi:MAG: tetratricopeptide repeat protein, partial [Fidelibacterota bacterium]